MNKLPVLFLGVFLSLFLLLPSCNDWEENYSTRPDHLLSFSMDTVSFDTVFTSIGSATRQLKIYNRNSSPLKISSVSLSNSNQTGFRINVDGMSGERFSDITIGKKDSLFVFVEVTVDPKDENNPFLMRDSILFLTNGVTQHVILQAYGQDVHIIKGGKLFDKDTLLTAERPYLVYDSIQVGKEARLEIEAGATFYMYDRAKWIIEGTLEAIGSQEMPVTFRGHRLDNISTNYPYDHLPAQWGGMVFRPESFGNIFDYVILRNTTDGILLEESLPDETKITISNSQFTNARRHLLKATNCRILAVNSEFTNAGRGVAVLQGGSYEFIHCTLANYMRQVTREYACLVLTNQRDDAGEESCPLTRATFINTIIDGSYSPGGEQDSLKGELSFIRKEGIPFEYEFDHCVVKTRKINNPYFTEVQFAESPDYRIMGSSDNYYLYDFRLKPGEDGNVAIGNADRTVSTLYPLDRYGNNRLGDENGPDIGAYEYVPDPEE